MPTRVKSAQRVAEILRLLAGSDSGLTLAEVAGSLKVPRSSAHALLVDLAQSRLVEAERWGGLVRYRIGLLSFEVGMAFLAQRNLAGEANVVVERVAAGCDETAHLAILDQTDVVYVAKAESSKAMRVASAVGARVPAHGTGVGKVLLAALTSEELLALYPDDLLPRLTPTTVADRTELVRQLKMIRELGYAFDDEESTLGLQCLAVPVIGHTGRCVAALSVSIPSVRMSGLDRQEMLDFLRTHSAALSLKLGWRERGGSLLSGQATS
ncbi:MAG TPA: IclR family transcriptional regulator [Mycobacteriales bacterium]